MSVKNTKILEAFTPPHFIAGFVRLSSATDDPLEVAWHAAAQALESEQVRLVFSEADEGVYFIAAVASEFASHPYAATPLAMALPGSKEFQGNGAYLCDIGGGLTAIVIKSIAGLQSYCGERKDALIFAEAYTQYAPVECVEWRGYRQMERKFSRHLISWISFSFLFLALALFIAGLGFQSATVSAGERKRVVLEKVVSDQAGLIAKFNSIAVRPDPYRVFLEFSRQVTSNNGRINKFDSALSSTTFEAEFPQWAGGLEQLGAHVKTALNANGNIIATGTIE